MGSCRRHIEYCELEKSEIKKMEYTKKKKERKNTKG